MLCKQKVISSPISVADLEKQLVFVCIESPSIYHYFLRQILIKKNKLAIFKSCRFNLFKFIINIHLISEYHKIISLNDFSS